jgi:glycosyltransferase involved in cell wall biosynthesis
LIKHIRQEQPEIVVAFSVRTSLALALALPFVRVKKVVLYMTGLGLLELMPDLKSRVLRGAAYGLLRATSRRKNCYFIFENRSDPVSMGFKAGAPERKVLLVGAGVDDSEFVPRDFPPTGVFKLATASRLVWSKGIDLAAQAVSELVAEGHAIELDVYGSPDPANPRSLDPATLVGLRGVSFKGHTDDVAGMWEHHHAAVFATRGGEGVPRSLLEAAACGRPCVVTDVAGCRDFIRDGVEGYVVEPNSVQALKDAFLKLMNHPEKLHVFGRAARERVLQASTSRIVQRQYVELFDA